MAKQKKTTEELIENLAIMVKDGFDDVDKKFVDVNRKLEGINDRLEKN